MRLHEIIDMVDKNIKRPIKSAPRANVNKTNYIGNGNFSAVYANSKDPHMVNKNSIALTKRVDGFDAYVKAIAESGFNGVNPYLPRIYVRKQFNSSDDKTAFKYEMEKLSTLSDLRFDEIYAAGEKVGVSEESLAEILNDYNNSISANDDESAAEAIDFAISTVIQFIDDVVTGSAVSADMQLNQAAILIENTLKISPKFEADITNSNVMFRRSPVGVQLVISDPIFTHK